jgi:hypothetical protein
MYNMGGGGKLRELYSKTKTLVHINLWFRYAKFSKDILYSKKIILLKDLKHAFHNIF